MNKTLQFFIGKIDGQGFFALSNIEPFFCLHGNTEKEAVDSALKAWEFYLTVKGTETPKAHVKKKSPFATKVKSFIPETIITAVA